MTAVREFTTKEIEAGLPAHTLEIIPTSKWVRVRFAGEWVADSKNVLLLRQKGRSPVYYFPIQDVCLEFLEDQGRTGKFLGLGKASLLTVRVGSRVAENSAWRVVEPTLEAAGIEGYIAFKWADMDAWFEEEEQVHVHPRDPYTRIDTIHSQRHVRVELNGEIIAETDRPVVLFETGLPARYYIPLEDVRAELFAPSNTHTACPYKGTASYYSIQVGGKTIKDVAWYYPTPNPEVGNIQNLVSFYPERVDAVYVDGVKLA